MRPRGVVDSHGNVVRQLKIASTQSTAHENEKGLVGLLGAAPRERRAPGAQNKRHNERSL
jgi:hypothetical protein